jgi:exodeoxyribonuclease-3
MKLILWNCQGAFRNKAEIILRLKPDILVIQECENPEKLIFNNSTIKPNDFLWFGDNQHKGLGIFSFSDFKFEILEQHNPEFKIVVPIKVTNHNNSFVLFAIWANNAGDKNNRYIEQVWKAINYYDEILNTETTILAGDFNSNKIWDRKHRIGNHSTVVDKLESKSIFSIYHKHYNEEQGKESKPTFYLQRNKDKPYHIDYCFASENLMEKFKDIEIGTYENWIEYSDHSPVIVKFEL